MHPLNGHAEGAWPRPWHEQLILLKHLAEEGFFDGRKNSTMWGQPSNQATNQPTSQPTSQPANQTASQSTKQTTRCDAKIITS
jgi:hypothetical protein